MEAPNKGRGGGCGKEQGGPESPMYLREALGFCLHSS